MIGIYKITSPSEKVYIGQAINIGKRKESYIKLKCKGQPKLYNSLVKYGFSNHIFEVVEQCSVEELSIRERHWQDFYDVVGESGLNCRLTSTEDKSGYVSQESIDKQSLNLKAFYRSEKGLEMRHQRSANLKAFYKTTKGKETRIKQVANMDYSIFQEKRLANTDQVAKARKAVANTDYAARSANTDYKAAAVKRKKAIIQYSLVGEVIENWNSAAEAGDSLKIARGSITACCRGKLATAGKFIWKYR